MKKYVLVLAILLTTITVHAETEEEVLAKHIANLQEINKGIQSTAKDKTLKANLNAKVEQVAANYKNTKWKKEPDWNSEQSKKEVQEIRKTLEKEGEF